MKKKNLVYASLIGNIKERPLIKLKFRQEDGSVKYSTIKGFPPYYYIDSKEAILFPYLSRKEGYYTYLNRPVDKLSFNSIEDLITGKRNSNSQWESDFSYLNRLLIDSNLVYGMDRRLLYLDIEVERGTGSLDTENSPQPIIVIDVFDSYTNKHYPFALEEYAEKGIDAKIFSTEKEMLNAFFNFYNQINPDVVITFNGISYDLPYLYNRSKQKDIFEKYHKNIYLQDAQHIDILQAYYEFVERGKRSSLDHISYLQLGKRKTKSFKSLRHCIEDVTLTKEVDEYLKLSKLVFTFQNIVPLNSFDVMHRSNVIEAFLLKKYHNKYVLPNRGHVEHIKYKGAIVREPVKGLYQEEVSVLDLVSLYPSIVMQYNISPDRELREPGIISKAIKEIYDIRLGYKRVYKEEGDEQSEMWNTAYKFLLNAIIGMYGYPNSRFYNRELAQEVTSKEREILTNIWSFVEKKDIKIIAGDTDSIFAKFDDVIGMVDEINDMLHKKYGEGFEIDLDKKFKVLFMFDKKKNYIGLNENGKLKVTGTVINKTSCPIFIRDCLIEYFKLLLNGKSTKKLKEQIQKDIYNQDIMDVCEWIKLATINPTNETAQLKAAKNRKLLYNIPYFQGEKLPMIPTKDSRFRILAIHEDIDVDKIPQPDYQQILNKWFYRTTNEVEGILQQKDLGEF